MSKPTRYTGDILEEYFGKGFWTADTTSKLWEENARRYPDKEAYVSSNKRISWSQIKELSDRLALSFLKSGLERDDRLLMILPNCCESYIVRVACEKAGILCGTALTGLREREIEYICSKIFHPVATAIPWQFRRFNYYRAIEEIRTGLPTLRYIFVLGQGVPSGTISIEKLIEGPLERRDQKASFEDTEYNATEVSVIAFTSGTTGIPKGVEHCQCARIAMARAYGEAVDLTGDDIVLNVISGVGGVGAAFCYNGATALVGAKTVLLEIWNAENALEQIEDERVTILLSVPTQLAQIVCHPTIENYDLRSLRCVCCGTAPLSPALAERVEEKLKVPVVNTYGQMDGGLVAKVNIGSPPQIRYRTVGKPPKGSLIRIVGENGREVPQGEAGEITYTGPTTSAGYYQDLESTLKGWGRLGKEGFFRSGDLGRLDESGNLVILGRKREVIIRGGQNIYPIEIEELLLENPKVKSVAIIPMPDPIMGEKVCAYVSLMPGEDFTFEEMISYLRSKKIALYKLPERLEILDELPLRHHHKIAKAELRQDLICKLKKEGKLSALAPFGYGQEQQEGLEDR
jgi:non-ribosomal peptide synthetase component E (peptide arylation enzyme)